MNNNTDIDEYKVQEHSRHDFITRHLYLLVKDSCTKLQIVYDPKVTERLYNSFLETHSLTDLAKAIKIIKTFAVKLISYFVVYIKLMRKLIICKNTYSDAQIQSTLEKTISSMRVIHLKALETYYLHHPNKNEVVKYMSGLVSSIASKALFIVSQLYLLSSTLIVERQWKIISYI